MNTSRGGFGRGQNGPFDGPNSSSGSNSGSPVIRPGIGRGLGAPSPSRFGPSSAGAESNAGAYGYPAPTRSIGRGRGFARPPSSNDSMRSSRYDRSFEVQTPPVPNVQERASSAASSSSAHDQSSASQSSQASMSKDAQALKKAENKAGISLDFLQNAFNFGATALPALNVSKTRSEVESEKQLREGTNTWDDPKEKPKKFRGGTEYAEEIKRQNQAKFASDVGISSRASSHTPFPIKSEPGCSSRTSTSMDETLVTNFEDISTVFSEMPNEAGQDPDAQHVREVYFDASKSRAERSNLLIASYEEKIARIVAANRVVIICGPTGCGKTTQVPQYIANHCVSNTRNFNIIITQPRRIAAISVSKRVCQERNWELGTICGYQIGMDRQYANKDTRLLYCTTGVLLQKLINDPDISKWTHIIVDEVHERNEDTDLLLMVLRQLAYQQKCPTKIVLMSATFDVGKFKDYFAVPLPLMPGRFIHPQVIDLAPVDNEKGKNNIKTYYLNHLQAFFPRDESAPAISLDEPELHPALYPMTVNLIAELDKCDLAEGVRGGVLVFLPGYEEIADLQSHLDAYQRKSNQNWWILPLHSTITQEEQNRVFQVPTRMQRKIILATNIAESSITVPDIDYVIDFCLTKNLVMDEETSFPTLRLEWASQANCTQRAGRTGRLRHGRAYRMVPESIYHKFEKYPVPELVRSPLTLSVLRVKRLKMGGPKELLGLCLDPPDLDDILRAVLELKQVGALTVFDRDGVYIEDDGELTSIGEIMSSVPIDIRLAKLIILGHVLDVFDDCVIIAACLSLQSMFSRPFNKQLEVYMSRLSWANRSFSDLFAFFNAYKMFRQMEDHGFFEDQGKKAQWCRTNFVQLKRITEVQHLVEELKQRCRSHLPTVEAPNIRRDRLEDELILKVAICGAFYPNYFLREDISKDAIPRTLTDKDVTDTVMIQGLPQNTGFLYADQIRKIFSFSHGGIDLVFEETRALVTFKNDTNPLDGMRKQAYFQSGEEYELEQAIRETAVKTAVYIAVKMRELRHPMDIKVFRDHMAKKKVEELQQVLGTENIHSKEYLRTHRLTVPAVYTSRNIRKESMFENPDNEEIPVVVTHVIDCGHFYVTQANKQQLAIQTDLGNQIMRVVRHPDSRRCTEKDLKVGMLVLAPLPDFRASQFTHHRATIMSCAPNGECKAFFIDIGSDVTFKNCHQFYLLDVINPVHKMIAEHEAMAHECKLCCIRPCAWKTFDGTWSKEAKDDFIEKVTVHNKKLMLRIYSYINGIIRCYLSPISSPMTINEWLIEKCHAEKASELAQSKADHRRRLEARRDGIIYQTTNAFEPCVVPSEKIDSTTGPITVADCIKIKGPYSPIEASFCGVTKNTYRTRVLIERDSVNSVVLEDDSTSLNSRCLVAASITRGDRSGKCTARATTLMPNIRGFPYLMALIFAPTCEFRLFDDKHGFAYYSGAIFGLGFNGAELNCPSLDPNNDIDMTFNAAITQADILDVNMIRMWINDAVGESAKLAGIQLNKTRDKIRKKIITYLMRYRRAMVPYEETKKAFRWGQVNPDDILDYAASLGHTSSGMPHIFRAHACLKVEDNQFVRAVNENLTHLKLLTETQLSTKSTCKLCNVLTYTIQQLAEHMREESHLEMVTEFVMFKKYGEWPGKHELTRSEIEMHDIDTELRQNASTVGESMDDYDDLDDTEYDTNTIETSTDYGMTRSTTQTPSTTLDLTQTPMECTDEDEFLYGQTLQS